MTLFDSAYRAPGECIVSIDGEEIADMYPFLLEVSVDAAREAATEATLRFETRRDVGGDWIVQDDPRIRPWKRLRIDAAFGDATEEVMRGFIREIRVSLPADIGAAEVTVVVQDESLALDRHHRRRAWGSEEAPTTDRDIVTAILAGHDLAATEPPAAGQSGLALNQDDTDIKFLLKRAEANGYELLFRAGSVYFGPMRLAGEAQATIMAYAGSATHCSELAIQDDGHRPDRVAYELAAETGADTEQDTVGPDLERLGPEPTGSEGEMDDAFVWRLSQQGDAEAGRARDRAQQQANRESLKVHARGTLDGTAYGHVLLTGATVGLDGVGSRHSGTWYVDRVSHQFDSDGYRQDFELLRNAYGDNLQQLSNPLAAVV